MIDIRIMLMLVIMRYIYVVLTRPLIHQCTERGTGANNETC